MDWEAARDEMAAQLRALLEVRSDGMHPGDEWTLDHVMSRRDATPEWPDVAEWQFEMLKHFCQLVIELPKPTDSEADYMWYPQLAARPPKLAAGRS